MKTRAYILIVYCAVSFCGVQFLSATELDPHDISDRLRDQFGKSYEYLVTTIPAVGGFTIVKTPQSNAEVVGRQEKTSLVNVVCRVKHKGVMYYMTDWSFFRYGEGKSHNWIRLTEAADMSHDSLLPLLDHLKHDDISRNCQTSYNFFFRSRNDPDVISSLLKRLNVERDIQARSALFGVLCASGKFEHNEKFFQALLDHLEAYHLAKSLPHELRDQDIQEKTFQVWWSDMSSEWIRFIVRNGNKYSKATSAKLHSRDSLTQWICTYTLVRHDRLSDYKSHVNDVFYTRAFAHLRSDDVRFNAQYAMRSVALAYKLNPEHVSSRLNQKLDRQERFILSGITRDPTNQEFRQALMSDWFVGSFKSEFFYGDDSDTFKYRFSELY